MKYLRGAQSGAGALGDRCRLAWREKKRRGKSGAFRQRPCGLLDGRQANEVTAGANSTALIPEGHLHSETLTPGGTDPHLLHLVQTPNRGLPKKIKHKEISHYIMLYLKFKYML